MNHVFQIFVLLVLVVGGIYFIQLMRKGNQQQVSTPRKRLRAAKSAQEALPQIIITDGMLQTEPGVYHAYIDVDLATNFYLLDPEAQRASVMTFHEMLQGNPKVAMQIALPALRTDLREHEARLRNLAAEATDASNQRVLVDMADWLRASAAHRQPLRRGRYIVLTYRHEAPRRGEEDLSDARKVEVARNALEHEAGRILSRLDAMGCSARLLNGTEIAQLLWQTLDRDRARIASMTDILAQGHGNMVTVGGGILPPLTMRDGHVVETDTIEMLKGGQAS